MLSSFHTIQTRDKLFYNSTNSNLSGIVPSSKLLYCFKNIPQLAKKTNKEDEKAEILRWYKTIPIDSVGIAFHPTDIAGFFQGGGRRLLLAFSKGEYGGILIMSYWVTQSLSYATVENNVLSDRVDFALK